MSHNMYYISSVIKIYYNGRVTEYTSLFISCDTCLQWDSHYNILKATSFSVYILQHLVLKYILWHFLYTKTNITQSPSAIYTNPQIQHYIKVQQTNTKSVLRHFQSSKWTLSCVVFSSSFGYLLWSTLNTLNREEETEEEGGALFCLIRIKWRLTQI